MLNHVIRIFTSTCTGAAAPKAPLCKGWCSAQRIKIIIVASGNDTLIHLLAKFYDF